MSISCPQTPWLWRGPGGTDDNKEKWVRQADSNKEAQRDREGVNKGKIKTECQAEANQESAPA